MIEITPALALAFVLTTGAGTIMMIQGLKASMLERRHGRCPTCGGHLGRRGRCPRCDDRF